MSGAGKTTVIRTKLPKDKWFHYSGDYRIGTKYLEEPILDNIKQQAMCVPIFTRLSAQIRLYLYLQQYYVENQLPSPVFWVR